MKRRLLVSMLALAVGDAAAAQTAPVATDIQPDGSLNTTVVGAGNVYTIDGGRVAGTNLFHSFAGFDLGSGEVAQWVHTAGNPAELSTVINRVTGGDPSRILGTLDSRAIPNADFYFINPAGIVFGDGARVNVPAAAHFSTARELRFTSGPAFQTATPDGSTLSVASPAAFGFLGGESLIGLIGVGAGFLPGGGELTLTAADVGVENSALRSGGIVIAAVGADAAEVRLDGTSDAPLQGNVDLVNSTVLTVARPGAQGDVQVNAGRLTLENSQLTTVASANRAGGDLAVAAGTVLLTGSTLSTFSDTARDAGAILLRASNLDSLQSSILSETMAGGDAGSIRILAGDVTLTDSAVASSTEGSGDTGAVLIRATGAVLSQNSYFSAAAFGSGAAADIGISGRQVSIADSFVGAEPSTSGSPGAGSSGDIIITAADTLGIRSSFLTTSTTGSANAGNIRVSGREAAVDNSTLTSDSFNTAGVAAPGAAGNVLVEAAQTLDVTNSSLTSAASCTGDGCASGNAGVIGLAATDISVTGSLLTTDVGQSGLSGGILVDAGDQLDIEQTTITSERGLVFLSAVGDATLSRTTLKAVNSGASGQQAGAIFVGGRNVTLQASLLDAANFADAGADESAGLIIFQAQQALSVVDSDLFLESFGSGRAGSLLLTGDAISLTNSAIISTAKGDGAGGAVVINGGDVSFDRSNIDASSEGAGQAGFVTVDGERSVSVIASDVASSSRADGAAGDVFVQTAELSLDDGRILSEGEGSGAAGRVTVQADSLTAGAGSFISSSAKGTGAAGDVLVEAGDIVLAGGSRIASQSEGANSLNAGLVTVRGDSLLIEDGGFISSSTFGAGNAGDAIVEVNDIIVRSAGSIASQAGQGSTGAGGVVQIRAQSLLVEDGGFLDTSTFGPGDAGLLLIESQSLTVGPSGLITSRTLAGGNAGGIDITGGTVVVNGGSISSSAEPGATGSSGGVAISATQSVAIADGGFVDTESFNPNPAGVVFVSAPSVTISGDGSRISSANLYEGGDCGGGECAAGSVTVATLEGNAPGIALLEGGRLTTNSAQGPAGDISLQMAPDSLLILEGRGLPGIIETSSGPGTGGIISIAAPRAIISNGGRIRALGQSGGANVRIDTKYFIASADQLNRVEVDGNLEFSNAIYDVSAGTVNPDLSVLDASGVLRGQCPAVRSSGQLSEFTVREVGPYAPAAPPAEPAAEPPAGGAAPATGDCL